jgi:(1->4)-alpha-D-glucan 1-alpha-D-glucosylmutase
MRNQTAAVVDESSGISECLDRLAARKREGRPVSTYRLQMHGGFGFETARKLIPYLHDLGISHCYSSPILKARTGSLHGYDITDHNQFNPEIGSEQEFERWVATLKEHGMGLVLDIVPNHMGVGHGTNPWWQDVLEHGRASPYADFFDIDWNPIKPELRNKVLLPILGEPYGEELEQGRIRLHYEQGRFFLTYYDRSLPLDPQTIPIIFEGLGDLHKRGSQGSHPDPAQLWELEDILHRLQALPSHDSTDPRVAEQRRMDARQLLHQLQSLVQGSEAAREIVAGAVSAANGQPGNSRSFDTLHHLLERQAYRLALWRVSAEEINYRRFFDINDLVGLRMENPQVFAATHRLIRQLLANGSISGLRVDHPDGLFNPRQYFTRVQMLYAASQCCGPDSSGPVAENGIEQTVQEIFSQHDWIHRQAPLYVALEKILEPGEELPQEWPVDGTSGYDFAHAVNGIFVDRRNVRSFTNLYRRFIDGGVDPDQLVYESKKLIMNSALASEVTVLSHRLDEISSKDRRARDFTRKALADAIRETIACFPVYRTYIDERGDLTDRDRGYIVEAIVRAKRRNPSTPAAVYDFLRDILLLKTPDPNNHRTDAYRDRLYFTLKFQQLTGPVMAKGMEDTVCYVYNRLVSLNEVGGSPKQFGISVDDFHHENLQRAENWPNSMLATSTHDTKRSEDVRARLNILSEMPREWSAEVMRWRRMNRARKRVLGDGRSVPDHNEEYLLYQTLVGTWPWSGAGADEHQSYVRRMQAYMNKAVHEAKVNLSWINPNPEYSAALEEFIARILQHHAHGRPNVFLQSMEQFASRIALYGAMNSLSQTVLKITSPGVPDIYQGNELWDFSLVDPDNRRPVDFETRKRLLSGLKSVGSAEPLRLCQELLSEYPDGRIKLWTTMRALCFRRNHPDLFRRGTYVPLYASGERQEHMVAFSRSRDSEVAIVAVPRLIYRLCGGELRPPLGDLWGNTELLAPPGAGKRLENIFTGEIHEVSARHTLSCRELFGRFPVALLAGY